MAYYSQAIDEVTVHVKLPTETKAESTAATSQPASFRIFSSDSEVAQTLPREISIVSTQ